MSTTRVLVGAVLVVFAVVVGAAIWGPWREDAPSQVAEPDTPPSSADRSHVGPTAPTSEATPGSVVPTTPPTVPGEASGPAPVLVTATPVDPGAWTTKAAALPTMVLPSDCGLPLDEPVSLPNSPREYRGGTHGGIDFICGQRGRTAVAALGGRVVMANDSYVEPTPGDRDALLAQAQQLGRTPPWTLAMLFGRFVVLDHGVIPGAGHVVTVYAHLEQVDAGITPGIEVAAGQRLGEIGNRGTDPAATGADDPRSLHLHWELHVDDVYLGAGLDAAATRALYADLFGAA